MPQRTFSSDMNCMGFELPKHFCQFKAREHRQPDGGITRARHCHKVPRSYEPDLVPHQLQLFAQVLVSDGNTVDLGLTMQLLPRVFSG